MYMRCFIDMGQVFEFRFGIVERRSPIPSLPFPYLHCCPMPIFTLTASSLPQRSSALLCCFRLLVYAVACRSSPLSSVVHLCFLLPLV